MKRKGTAILMTILLLTLCAAGQVTALADGTAAGQYILFTLDAMGEQTDPGSMGMDMSLLLREDGTGVLVSNGAEEAITAWSEANGTLILVNSGGISLEAELHDGVIAMEMMAGFYLYFAREGVDTAGFQIIDRSPDSVLYGIYKSIDAEKGAHLNYDFHSDYMDSTSAFDVHARDGVFFSLRTTKAGGYEQRTATGFRDGTSYVLYPDEMRGNVATRTSSSIITNNVLMLDDLYGVVYQCALRTDFTLETRELDDVSYAVEVYPAKDYSSETAFYYDDAGRLVHVLVAPSQIAPELGETFYTVYQIDEAVNDALFDLSGYAITE